MSKPGQPNFPEQLSDCQVLVIGLGLMGGSLANALKRNRSCAKVLGYARRNQTLVEAKRLGIIDEGYCELQAGVKAADIVVVCTPLSTYETLFKEIDSVLSHNGALQESYKVITDVGSVKACVVGAARAIWDTLPAGFVPAHPIAGSEKSGVEAADAHLFRGHPTIVTPLKSSSSQAVALVTRLWEAVGASVSVMGLQDHDRVLAETSHLPHLVAYAMVDALAGSPDRRQIFQFAAGGFRDFTRIAASDVTMWHDIFMANKAALNSSAQKFLDGLKRLLQAIDTQASEPLCESLARAKEAREHFTTVLAQRGLPQRSPRPISIEERAAGMSEPVLDFYCQPGGEVNGQVRVPGDKSISHRSIMLGSIAEGTTTVTGFLEGEDSLATLKAFQKMGVEIVGPEAGKVTIQGVGLQGLQQPKTVLDMGNSGTSIRLLAGLLAGQSFDVTMTGDASLTKRPMKRVTLPLAEMGAQIEASEKGTPPLTIRGGKTLRGIDYVLPMASAQVKSCILLAGLYAQGETSVTQPAPTRDHTERMLQAFGVDLVRSESRVTLLAGQRLVGTQIQVPSDISSAAFFLVAAAITPGADLTLEQVGVNSTRIGIIHILKKMGADISLHNERILGGEPVADIQVKASPLKGIDIPQEWVPLAIDEFPVLFVAAVCAEGQTRLSGAEELRVKESDRIQVMADGLANLGVKTMPTPDGIVIEGGQSIGGGIVESHSDHRIAMAFSVASLRAQAPILIRGCDEVATSFPGFLDLAKTVGMRVQGQTRVTL